MVTHFLAAAMKKLGMESLEDQPSHEDFDPCSWMATDMDRKSLLYTFCQELVSDYVTFSLSCTHQVSTESDSADGILTYASQLMSLGIFYLNYKDAIREGDGERVLLSWKYLLPLFRVTNRRNYTVEVFNTLYSYYFTLSPRQAHQLIWSRFVNVHGLKGRNVACDIHMEHLNRVCKEAIKGVGANKTLQAIQRVSKVVGILIDLTKKFDEDLKSYTSSGYHKVASVAKDQQIILSELLHRAYVFNEQAGREHQNFKDMLPSIFLKVNRKKLESWIKDHISKKY